MSWTKRIGIIDILIVLVIVSGVLYVLKPFSKKGEITKSNTEIEYTFETIEVGQEFINQLEIGKDVYDSNKNYYLGKIKSFNVVPFRDKFEDTKNGTITLVDVPNQYNVLIDVEAKAVISNDTIIVDGEEIRVGLYIPVKGKGFASYGYIVKIERGDS